MLYITYNVGKKRKCSDNYWCRINTLLAEMLSFYYYASFQNFRTPLNSEPGTPLVKITRYSQRFLNYIK